LENSTIKGDQGPIGGGQLGAYTNVDFLIVSHVDVDLFGGQDFVKNEIGFVSNIGAYVIGSRFYPIIDELKFMYPDRNIIRADSIFEYVNKEIG